MTHQYKQMQKEYNDELESLTKKLMEREEELSNYRTIQKKTTTPLHKQKKSRTRS
jgi:hypothetical protein